MAKTLDILLVEDDEDDFILTREILSETFGGGFKLDWVTTWDAALEALHHDDYDVCLVDYNLGKRNGLDLVREAIGRGVGAPFIMLTGQDSREIDVAASNAGAADYLVKGQLTTPLLERAIRYAQKRKGIEVELMDQAEDLAIARDQSIKANRAKSEFLANISHELRTPLTAIIGFSDMICGQTFGPIGSPKYLEYVTDINESSTHLLELINDILDLSKVEAGKVELHEVAVDVTKTVRSCLLLVKERAETAGVNLKSEIADGLPPLYADERKLKQILINLLSNAVKFTPAGGKVTIKIWSRPDDGCVFQVTDTGIGIALGDIAKALAPFSQIDSDLSRKYDGTGLGLPLTKALVEAHGGSLDLQSELGAGTTVTVRFPAERIVLAAATGA